MIEKGHEIDASGRPVPPARLVLVALGCRGPLIRARPAGGGRTLLVRPGQVDPWPVEGEVFDLETSRPSDRGAGSGGEPRSRPLGGRIGNVRLAPGELGLEPLALRPRGPGEAVRFPLGGRPGTLPVPVEFELERVSPRLPRPAPDGGFVARALERWKRGERRAAESLLAALLRRDLRCLDAHAHLGYFAFNGHPEDASLRRALRHYWVGREIGELSLPADFDGILPWRRAGNRPYLRCLYGLGLCRWRLGDPEGAADAMRRFCRLCPGDGLAARLVLLQLAEGRSSPAPLT